MLPAARSMFLGLFIVLFMVTWSNDTGLRAAAIPQSPSKVEPYDRGEGRQTALSALTFRTE